MRRAALVAVAVVASGACGDNRFPIEGLAAQAREAYCARAVRCGLFVSDNACAFELHISDPGLPREVLHLQDPGVVAEVRAGKVGYDEAAARECIEALTDASCSRASEDARVDPPACARMFTGTVTGTDPCAFDEECVSGRCTPAAQCPDDYSCCIGTCSTAPHTVAIGSACAIDSDCGVDAFCTGAGCHALITEGEVCSNSGQCAFDLVCVTPGIGQSGECHAAPKIGDACASGGCADLGAHCGSGGVCIAASAPGHACAVASDCGEDQVCSGSGACARAPTLGEPCSTICLAGAWCAVPEGSDSGTCTAPQANGHDCGAPDQCVSGYCADGDFATTCIDQPVCM